MSQYDKPFKDYNELIDLLEKRNVEIPDKNFAINCLQQFSYYSLINGYKDLFPSDDTGKFLIPISFYDFYMLATFDRELNNLFFKYIIMIERKLKSVISYRISSQYGVETDLKDLTFNNSADYLYEGYYQTRKETRNTLEGIKRDISKSKNESVNHYLKNHNHLPCWILVNGLYFGRIIQLYNILLKKDKDYVCEKMLSSNLLTMDQKKEFIKSSLNIIRKYRNNIAHGNRTFTNRIKDELPKKQVLILSKGAITDSDYKKGFCKNDIFAVILIICSYVDPVLAKYFLSEIERVFRLLDKAVFSTGQDIFDLLSLPRDFLTRLSNFSV